MDYGKIIISLPDWMKFVSLILALLIISGAFKWTDFFTARIAEKKLEVKKEEVRSLTDRELGTTAFDRMNETIRRLEEEILELKKELKETRTNSKKEKKSLQEKIDGLEKEISGLKAHLAVIKTLWKAPPNFPQAPL